MKRLKLTVITYVSCLLFFGLVLFPAQGFSLDITSEDISSEEISRIANEGKEPFIGAIALEYYRQFGNSEAPGRPVINLEDALDPSSDIHKELKENPIVELGDPFRVYTIETQDILNYNSDIDLSSILVPTTQWFVPVFIHKKPRAILTVDYLDGELKVVNIGMGDISEKVDKNEKMGLRGDNSRSKFVRIYPAKSDFIVIDTNGKKKLLPFSYTVDALEIDIHRADSLGHYELSDIMPKLITNVKVNIAKYLKGEI